MKLSTAILIALMASPVFAGPYDGLAISTTTGKAERNISGKIGVAASSATYQTYLVTIDGTNGYNSTLQVTASSGTFSGPVMASQFNGSGAGLTAIPSAQLTGSIPVGLVNLSSVTTALSNRVAKAGDTMTGGLTLLTSSVTVHNATSGTAFGAFRFYDDSPNNPVVTLGMNSVGTKTELVTCAGGSNCGPGAGGYSWAADGNTMGFNTSGVLSAPSFSGPLTGLASLNLPLTGGTLTGPLTLAGSSLTVNGTGLFNRIETTGQVISSGPGSNYFAGNTSIGAASIFPAFTNFPAVLQARVLGISNPTPSGNNSYASFLQLSSSKTTTGNLIAGIIFSNEGAGAEKRLAQISVTAGSTKDKGAMSFLTTGASFTEKMRLDENGLLGIGTTSPASKVDISSGTIRMAGTGAPTTGGALCLNAAGAMAKCTSAIDASGNCTCP